MLNSSHALEFAKSTKNCLLETTFDNYGQNSPPHQRVIFRRNAPFPYRKERPQEEGKFGYAQIGDTQRLMKDETDTCIKRQGSLSGTTISWLSGFNTGFLLSDFSSRVTCCFLKNSSNYLRLNRFGRLRKPYVMTALLSCKFKVCDVKLWLTGNVQVKVICPRCRNCPGVPSDDLFLT